MTEIHSGEKQLWIFGYVDYIDIFKQRHRASYVRTYCPHVGDEKVDNLLFNTEGRYNYDRPRNEGEGRDWNERA